MSTHPSNDPFWERVRELFHEAAPLHGDERRAFLDRACDDAAVRAEVESLLAEVEGEPDFLDRSVWDLVEGADARWEGAHIGPYRVVRPIGAGGMGSVFLAARDDEQFEQRVAIKLVRRTAAGPELLQRFRQERQILAALEHPNIARLLDGGATSGGLPYLVMEYVEGTPIDEYCRVHALPIEARLLLFLDLCDAVQSAHRNLVIHRDIKPANVLVTSVGVPKLLDFGIAKLTTDPLRADATVTRLMTPDYASPEQLHGSPVSTATDVYSLGILLFEILTGARPFAGVQRTAISEAPKPSSVAGQRALRGDLDRIVLKALEPDPAQRYGSVDKLADDIRRHLGGHPVAARGASLGYRTAKFVRRNKLFVAAAAVAMVVIIIAFAAVVQQKRIAERRFQEVRSLAHSVVFELHDAIANLPGSTPARELLVRRALGYLDALAAESARNTPLQMELAGAYLRIGDVQGMPYRPNLGDTAGALISYGKGLVIAQEMHAREPDNKPASLLLADLHDRAGLIEQRALRYRPAIDHHEAARAIRESIPDRGVGERLALARTWIGIADCIYLSSGIHPVNRQPPMTAQAAYETAARILQRIPPQGPHRRDLLMEIARTHQRLGGYFTGAPPHHDTALALTHHNIALRALEERMTLDPNDAPVRRNWADHLVMMATLQNANGDGTGALANTTRALAALAPLAAADPNNVEGQHDLAFVYEQRARAQTLLRRFDDAEQSFLHALAIRERLVAADHTNREDRRGVAGLHGLMASLYRAKGDTARTAEMERQGKREWEALRR